MQTPIYNPKGERIGSVELADHVFALPWNAALIHQAVETYRANHRSGTARVKTRGEVRGGGKKPWRQKGTGRARHGSIRSPLWIGGGVTHGPTAEKNYGKKINIKMRKKALGIAFSQRLRDGGAIVVDGLNFPEGKTRAAVAATAALRNLAARTHGHAPRRMLLLFPSGARNASRAFRNIPGVAVKEDRLVNAADVISFPVVSFSQASVAVLESILPPPASRAK